MVMFRYRQPFRFGLRYLSGGGGNISKCRKEPDNEAVNSSLIKEPGNETMDSSLIKSIAILTGSQLVLNLGFSQIVPVMPLFAAQIGGHLGATGVGMVISAPSFARLLLNLPLGRVADKVGRKPLMWAGTAVTATGTIMTGFSSSFWTILSCRMMVGAGSSMSMTGSSAYLADLSDKAPKHRAKIMGLNNMLVGSVWVVGPALGGYLAATYGLQNSFIIAGIGAALCSLGYSQLPETLVKVKGEQEAFSFKDWWQDTKVLLGDPNQQALIANACIFPLRFSCFSTVVALHATSVAAMGPMELGWMFTIMALCQGIGMPIGSYMADKVQGPRKWIVGPGSLLSAGCFGMLALAATPMDFYMIMGAQGFFNSFAKASVGAFTAESTKSERRGQALSLHRSAADAIALVGPISFGLIADVSGSSPATIIFTSALMGSVSLVYLVKARMN